jgi:hypothetical protein
MTLSPCATGQAHNRLTQKSPSDMSGRDFGLPGRDVLGTSLGGCGRLSRRTHPAWILAWVSGSKLDHRPLPW